MIKLIKQFNFITFTFRLLHFIVIHIAMIIIMIITMIVKL